METLTAVCKMQDGFGIRSFKVKKLDMNEIVRAIQTEISGWGFDSTNFEIFQKNAHDKSGNSWLVVAQHTGRGWVRISTFVDNWEKYATSSWIKRAKSNMYFEKRF